jgi:hypothetical protein
VKGEGARAEPDAEISIWRRVKDERIKRMMSKDSFLFEVLK